MRSKPIRRQVGNAVRARGVTSLLGNDWIKVWRGTSVVYVPHGEFMTSPRDAKVRLANGKIVLIGPDWTNLIAKVRRATFRVKPLLEHVGWTKPYFALPNGRVLGPPGHKPVALFRADATKCARAGTLGGWRRDVAGILDGQTLPMFVLMAVFAAPLLKLTRRTGNFGFELVGPPGTGKSTLLYTMASTVGGAVESAGENYWNTCNTTVNALEKKALQHVDLPLLLDDATGFAGEDGATAKGNKFKSFVFNLAQAETKDRWNDEKGPQGFRLIYFLTANTSLPDVIANVAENEAGATADRLLTLDVGLQESGIFDFIPSEYEDGTGFARALVEGLSAQHGTAMPAFLEKLVQHRAKDEAKLVRCIQARSDRFLARVQVDRSNASAVRWAEAFGLVMTAGELAQHYGILPSSYDCEAAAVGAYRLFQASTVRMSCLERLLAYAGDPCVIDMDAAKRKYLTLAEFEKAPGAFRIGPAKEREFLVHPDTFRRAFPDWRQVLRNPDVARLMEQEKPHKTIKRTVTQGEKTDHRVYCFRF